MADLARRLTRFDLTMMVVGSSIGSGIFLTPSDIARELPSPWAMLAVWLMGGLMTLAGALTYAELGALMPGAGGVYVFLTEAYGDLVGFLYGWANILVVTTGSIAALAVVFATYVGHFVPLSEEAAKGVAVLALVVVTAVNVYGVKAGARMTNLFTLLKLGGIALVVGVGLFAGSPSTSDFGSLVIPDHAPTVLGAALVGVLWSYGGWQHATFAAGETKNPTRDVPIALGVGALVVTTVYLLTNVAYMFLLTPAEMAGTKELAAAAVATKIGAIGGSLVALAIVVSTFGTAGIFTMSAPRMYYAMAQRGLFFARVGVIDPRTRTPAFAIVLQAAWSAVLVLFWGTFKNLIAYVLFSEWIFFALAGASVFILRRKMPGAARPYRVPGYPATPLLFVGGAVWFIAMTLVGKPVESLAGIGLVALGVPAYFVWKWYRRT